jgi:cytochrome c5
MPPHGGNMQLSDTEIKRAVATWSISPAGTGSSQPASKTRGEAHGERNQQSRCAKCHETGGAPKIGDCDAWIPRVKDGLDSTVRSAINGHGGMPEARRRRIYRCRDEGRSSR